MRKVILISTLVAVAAFCAWIFWPRLTAHRLTLHGYYQHVQNVEKGMPVCVDGVQFGSVESVTVRPELGERPVEVVLNLHSSYKLEIPAGSTAQVAEPGILRPAVVDIDTRTAHGPAIADGGRIEGRESTEDRAAHALGVVVKAIVDQSKEQKADHSQKPNPLR